MSACRLHPQFRTYGCNAANRRFGPLGDIGSPLLITSSASRSMDCGMPSPSAFAVRLMTNSNVVDRKPGRVGSAKNLVRGLPPVEKELIRLRPRGMNP
jgi:hypothetical protein